MKARTIAAGVLVALLSVSSSALGQERRDRRIAEDIARQVNTYSRFTIFDDVNIAVENGLVTLTGKVTMPYKRDDIGKRVAKVDGITAVQNRIDVLPVSQFDN